MYQIDPNSIFASSLWDTSRFRVCNTRSLSCSISNSCGTVLWKWYISKCSTFTTTVDHVLRLFAEWVVSVILPQVDFQRFSIWVRFELNQLFDCLFACMVFLFSCRVWWSLKPRVDSTATSLPYLLEFASQFESSPHWSIRTWLSYLQRGGGPKKRFQYCLDPHSAETILYLRAFRRQSGGDQLDPALQDIVLLPNDFAEYIYHGGSSHDMHSIIQSGLILGGKDIKKGRQTVFFTAMNPMHTHHTSSEIPTWRVLELQCTKKIGESTRTQCTGPIWELLRKREWRSIKRDLTRSSFTTLYQQRVLRKWWQWVQEK